MQSFSEKKTAFLSGISFCYGFNHESEQSFELEIK